MVYARVGIYNTVEGREIITSHLEAVVQDQSSIVGTRAIRTKEGAIVIQEERQSLLAAPGGFLRLESFYEIMPDGSRRLTSIIPKEGRK